MWAPRRALTLLAMMAVVPGCAYISNDKLVEKLHSLDQDGDGAHYQVDDCDDYNADRHPGNTEVAYDGVDQDCDKLHLDLLDQDGDSYPGVDKATYIAAFDTDGDGYRDGDEDTKTPVWPEDIKDTLDCDDSDANVYPGAVETWYRDGDQDCAGDDDFDQDGDGYVPTAYADQSSLPSGDCDDTRADVNPGVDPADDDWYDGVDQDCAGNDDFDQDGDGYIPDAATIGKSITETAWHDMYTTYLAKYGYTYDSMYGHAGEIAWGDCVDSFDGTEPWGASPGPEAIHPGATDAPYDMVDADCDKTNDFDRDGDNYIPTEWDDDFQSFKKYWGYGFDPGDNDCDDADATVHPGTMEIIGDKTDQDCDSGVDTTPAGFGSDLAWTNVRQVSVANTDHGFLIGTAADDVTVSSVAHPYVGVTLVFDETALTSSDPNDYVIWQGSGTANPLGDGVDVIASSDRFWGSTSYESKGNNYLVIREVAWDPTKMSFSSSTLQYTPRGSGGLLSQIDLRVDPDSYVWAFGCNDSVAQYMATWDDPGATPAGKYSKSGTDYDESAGGDDCFVSIPSGGADHAVGTVCTSGVGCTSYDLPRTQSAATTTLATSASQSWSEVSDVLNTSGGFVAIGEPGGGATVRDDAGATVYSDLLTGYTIRDIDASYDPINATLYVAAVVQDDDGDGRDDVVLAYGTPPTLTEVRLPLVQTTDLGTTTYSAEHVGLYVGEDDVGDGRVLVAASGHDDTGADTVAWYFLGR